MLPVLDTSWIRAPLTSMVFGWSTEINGCDVISARSAQVGKYDSPIG